MNGKLTSKNDRMAEWNGRENCPKRRKKYTQREKWNDEVVIERTANITGPNSAVEMGKNGKKLVSITPTQKSISTMGIWNVIWSLAKSEMQWNFIFRKRLYRYVHSARVRSFVIRLMSIYLPNTMEWRRRRRRWWRRWQRQQPLRLRFL